MEKSSDAPKYPHPGVPDWTDETPHSFLPKKTGFYYEGLRDVLNKKFSVQIDTESGQQVLIVSKL